MRALSLLPLLVVVACGASDGGEDVEALASNYGEGCTADTQCAADEYCAKTISSSGTVCLPFARACEEDTETNRLLSQALAKAGKELCDLGQKPGSIGGVYPPSIASDRARSKLYERLFNAPAAIPPTGKRLVDEARAARAKGAFASGPIRLAARLWDEDVPKDVAPDAPARSFEQAVTDLGGDPSSASSLPADLKSELAPILAAVKTAVDLRNGAIPAGTDLARWFRAPIGMFWQGREVVSQRDKIDITRPADAKLLFDEMRWGDFARGAVVISEAIEKSALRTRASTGAFGGTFSFDVGTPHGRIVIKGSGDDVYAAADAEYLFVVDTGGNDRYEVPVGGTQSPNNPVSVAIDLGGDDTYTYAKLPVTGDGRERPVADAAGRRPSIPHHSLSEVRRQGSGTLGVGLLFDFGNGKDVYESLRWSQGSGVLGVGVLYDDGGDDSYIAETVAQGGATFGIGLLIDGGGNDRYHGYSVTQGATFVKAVGLLLDYDGDDVYWTSPGNAYIGPDRRIGGHDYFYEYGVNQGASWGRRGDYPQDGIRNDGHLSGGTGALLDLGGNDKYTCSAFCQGTGYWFGTGILWDDGEGKDETFGRIFAAGTGVHFGLGIHHDGGGDDLHHVFRNGDECEGLTFGSGDDLSLGWFEDLGGNDKYAACRNSIGSGTEKGVGVFVDLKGDDSYASRDARAFGSIEDPPDMQATTSARYALKTQGVFADGAGSDTFSPALVPHATYPSPNVCAVSLDRP